MKEVQVLAWCDACRADDAEARVEGVTHKVRVDDMNLAEVELCERHDKELLEPLRRLVGEHGVPARKPAAQAAPAVRQRTPSELEDASCPVTGCGTRLQRRSLPNHVYQVHAGLGPNDPRPPGRPENVTALQWAVDYAARVRNGAS